MAEIKKISGLAAKSSPTGDDFVVIEASDGVNYKVKASSLSVSHNHSELLATVTIDSSKWNTSAKSQSITVAGAYAANSGIVMVTPATRTDADNWCDYGLFLDDSEPAVNTVKVTCTSIPSSSITVFVYRIG